MAPHELRLAKLVDVSSAKPVVICTNVGVVVVVGQFLGVDGALLVDLWDELYLRKDIRAAWQPLIDRACGGRS